MALIDDLRLKTYYEANEMLDVYGKACIIRPTGFGKTGILTRFIRKYTENYFNNETKVLFLYPSDPVWDAVLKFYYNTDTVTYRKIPNVQEMTYMSLIRMSNKAMSSLSDVSLIITDECHLTGATETSSALSRLLKALPNAKILGATATPLRSDEFDEVSYFYDNRVCSDYTLSDAFEDGVIKKPHYCYCSYAINNDLIEVKNKALRDLKGVSPSEKKRITKIVESKVIEVAKIYKMDSVIKSTFEECNVDTEYIKGVVFFKNIEHLRISKSQVVGWFKQAYPNHTIRTLTIATDTLDNSDNRFKLDKMCYQKNTIDLICCINILNLGYHISDLTFIGMFRGTKSATLFSQQLGRILSSGSSRAGIVFDLVDNLHSKSLTQVLDERKGEDINLKARYLELREKLVDLGGNDNNLDILSDDEKEEYILLRNMFRFEKYSSIPDIASVNKIYKKDLIATKNQASLADMLRKLIEEPKQILCKQAYKYWKDSGGDDSGGSPEYICSTCLNEGKVPITPYCAIKGVELGMVFKYIFGDRDYSKLVAQHTKEAKAKKVLVNFVD